MTDNSKAIEALKEMPNPKIQTSLAPEWYKKHYETIRAALQNGPEMVTKSQWEKMCQRHFGNTYSLANEIMHKHPNGVRIVDGVKK